MEWTKSASATSKTGVSMHVAFHLRAVCIPAPKEACRDGTSGNGFNLTEHEGKQDMNNFHLCY